MQIIRVSIFFFFKFVSHIEINYTVKNCIFLNSKILNENDKLIPNNSTCKMILQKILKEHKNN